MFTAMTRSNYSPAITKKLFISGGFVWSRIEESTLAILITLGAYPMRWFSIALRTCNRVNNSTVPWGVKLITILLGVPCFKGSYFFFKIIYFCQHRRILLEQRKITRLNTVNLSQQFVDLFEINNGITAPSQRKLSSRLKTI